MAIAAFGNQVLTTTLISFAVDSHKEHSASIGVFINLCRQIYGFVSPQQSVWLYFDMNADWNVFLVRSILFPWYVCQPRAKRCCWCYVWDYGSGVFDSGSFDSANRHEEKAPTILMRINSCGQIYDDVIGFCLEIFPELCICIEWICCHDTLCWMKPYDCQWLLREVLLWAGMEYPYGFDGNGPIIDPTQLHTERLLKPCPVPTPPR